jgi:hypothetical protein
MVLRKFTFEPPFVGALFHLSSLYVVWLRKSYLIGKIGNDPFRGFGHLLSECNFGDLVHFIHRCLLNKLGGLGGILEIRTFVPQHAAVNTGLGTVNCGFVLIFHCILLVENLLVDLC